jgi:hypothetical protein
MEATGGEIMLARAKVEPFHVAHSMPTAALLKEKGTQIGAQ